MNREGREGGYQSLEIYTPAGTHVRTLPLPGSNNPYGMTLAVDGTQWMTDRHGRKLMHVTRDGAVLATYPLNFQPGDVAENPRDRTLLVTDLGVGLRLFDRFGGSHYNSDGRRLDWILTPHDGPSYPAFLTIVPEPSGLVCVLIPVLAQSPRRR